MFYIAVVLLVLLVSVHAFRRLAVQKGKRRVPDIAKLEKIGHALNEYIAEFGVYPPALEDLRDFERVQLFIGTNANMFTDSWGRRLIYEPAGTNCALLCLGKDGERGTRDDLRRF